MVWKSHSRELHEHHDAIGTTSDLPSYLVRNLNHVRLRVKADGTRAHIIFSDYGLAEITVFATAELLLGLDPQRIIVERIGAAHALMMASDAEDVVAILVDQDACFRRPKLFREHLSLERLNEPGRLALLKQHRDIWVRSRGDLAAAEQNGLALSGPGRQYLSRVVHKQPQFEEMGSGFTTLGSVASLAKGGMVDDIPDREYGAWVAESILQTQYHGMPSLDLLEATSVLPGIPPFRMRYDRLLLPWRSRGEIVVSSIASPRIIFSST